MMPLGTRFVDPDSKWDRFWWTPNGRATLPGLLTVAAIVLAIGVIILSCLGGV